MAHRRQSKNLLSLISPVTGKPVSWPHSLLLQEAASLTLFLFHCLSQNNINQSRIVYIAFTKIRGKSMRILSSLKTFSFLPYVQQVLFVIMYMYTFVPCPLHLIFYLCTIDTLLCSILLILKTNTIESLIMYLIIHLHPNSWIAFDLELLSAIQSCTF